MYSYLNLHNFHLILHHFKCPSVLIHCNQEKEMKEKKWFVLLQLTQVLSASPLPPVSPGGCNDRAECPPNRHRIAMPLSSDEPVCPKFQPNIFDPSRCHECLRQKHMHASAGHASGAAAQQQISAKEAGDGSTNGVGRGKGVFLTPIPSQTDERDTSSKVGKTSLCETNSC